MTASFLTLAQIVVALVRGVASPAAAPAAAPATPLKPAAVLERYVSALGKLKEPRVISFDYTLDQTGLRTISQTHRVFRSGTDERDETLTVDGKRLTPPKVRIFRGRRNRYTVAALAPRVADYRFVFAEAVKDGRHIDYIFHLTPRAARAFDVTSVTIDGVRFLPLTIDFETGQNEGEGSISFGSNARWWVPYAASARAVVADDPATERLSFYTYRFPESLPRSAFGRAGIAAPSAKPPTLAPGAVPRFVRPSAADSLPAGIPHYVPAPALTPPHRRVTPPLH